MEFFEFILLKFKECFGIKVDAKSVTNNTMMQIFVLYADYSFWQYLRM